MPILRPATTDDILLLQRLSRETWRACYPGIISQKQIEYMLARMYDAEVIRQEIEAGVVWTIAEDGDPVGYASYAMADAVECRLQKLYVLPDRQGRGCGRALVGAAVDYAVAHGAGRITLTVNRNNAPALRAYRAYGFRVVADVDTPYGDFVLNDHVMAMALPARDAKLPAS